MFIIFRQEALESAISEKDAHLALLEFNGVHRDTPKQTDMIDQLKVDRARLIKRLHEEVSVINKNNNILNVFSLPKKKTFILNICYWFYYFQTETAIELLQEAANAKNNNY